MIKSLIKRLIYYIFYLWYKYILKHASFEVYFANKIYKIGDTFTVGDKSKALIYCNPKYENYIYKYKIIIL